MYATCLFCNNSLGANEAIAHFPVGRRLAFDSATGRLWVVCKACKRWNLSPLESRWEAIDEAERAFRSTKLRVSTDNIGLAQLHDGTELVRVGKPLQTEFAAWRYGNLFNTRRRNFLMFSGVAMAAPVVQTFGQIIGIGLGEFSTMSGMPFVYIGIYTGIVGGLISHVQRMRQKVPRIALRNDAGELVHISQANARGAALAVSQSGADWQLALPHGKTVRAGFIARRVAGPLTQVDEHRALLLKGPSAIRALGTIMPTVNDSGGGSRAVTDAVNLINSSPHLAALVNGPNSKKVSYRFFGQHGRGPLATMPAPIRLALEMSLHSDEERRAMEGELQELEQRWKDAEEVAKIADAMFLPSDIDEQVRALRSRKDKP